MDSGFPLSRVSSRASSSLWLSIRSAKRCSNRPRSDALVFRHGPWSKAARAAATALSTSAASASATWQISSPVEGLMVAKVLPDSLGTHRLLIRSLVAVGVVCVSAGIGSVEIIAPPTLILHLQRPASEERECPPSLHCLPLLSVFVTPTPFPFERRYGPANSCKPLQHWPAMCSLFSCFQEW